MCVFFVAAAMIEYAVLLHLNRMSETIGSQFVSPSNIQQIQSTSKGTLNLIVDDKNGGEGLLNAENSTCPCQNDKGIEKQRNLFLHKTQKIDYITLFVSCITFCLFNCIYWSYYVLL